MPVNAFKNMFQASKLKKGRTKPEEEPIIWKKTRAESLTYLKSLIDPRYVSLC